MLSLLILAILLNALWITATPEETYEDEPMLYVSTRGGNRYNSGRGRQLDEQRRSALDKNFVRFGRGGSNYLLSSEEDYFDDHDDTSYPDEFARPTRSQDKSDNFVRFGRGQSDFIRFGRNPYTYTRDSRGTSQNFLRFGRSPKTMESPKQRIKRDVISKYHNDEKKGDRSANFLRFGKAGHDNFMRFGRQPSIDSLNEDKVFPSVSGFERANYGHHGELDRYPRLTKLLQNPLLLRFLAEVNDELHHTK